MEYSAQQFDGREGVRWAGPAVLLAAVALSAYVIHRFHDRSWVAGDDGYYGHIAQRLLDGQVLHRDVQAMHPGYVYFVDAMALKAFGRRLVSLRYPLVALGVVQAAMIGALFLRRSPFAAGATAVTFTCLSYVLFPSPSVHWYCLFLLVAIVCALQWIPRGSAWRPLALGFLVVTLGLFRQLTGAFVAAGVVAYLLAEPRGEATGPDGADRPRSVLAARLVVACLALPVAAYVLMKGSWLGRGLFGLWAPAVLLLACYRAALGGRAVVRTLLLLAAGGAAAAAPMLFYHLATGSLGDWFNDSVVSAVRLADLEYVQVRRYGEMIGRAARNVVEFQDVRKVSNGVLWLALMFAPAALGVAVLRQMARGTKSGTCPHPLPFLAVVYAPVAIHFEAPAYVQFVAAPVAAGLLWLVTERATRGTTQREPATTFRRRFIAAFAPPPTVLATVLFAAGLSYVALRYQAGQAVARGHLGTVGGFEVGQFPVQSVHRLGLRISREDVNTYPRVLDVIRNHTRPGDAILSVPGGSEFYFLSGRRNPTPYPYIVYGVMDEASLSRTLETLRRDPPVIVIHTPDVSHNTPNTDRIMQDVRARYEPLGTFGRFDVYRIREVQARAE